MTNTQLQLGDLTVEVVFKPIKHIHLSVYPPDGWVLLAAPVRLDLETVRVYVLSKLGWIRQQQRKMREQVRETPRDYLDRESHWLWGTRYLLQVVEQAAPPTVQLTPGRILLHVRPGMSVDQRRMILANWYRQQLKAMAAEMIPKWETLLGVQVEKVFVQRMKTRWGGCNPQARTIRLNTELAKKPLACLEYVVVHELAHLREQRHDDRFKALLDTYLPQWPQSRDLLNSLPLGFEDWEGR